jgi:nicotinamide mononucleotide transporter
MPEVLRNAAAPLLAPAFHAGGAPFTWLELAASSLALAMVAANFRVHPVAWPLAIASSLGYALLFAASRLYGEASLQLYFAAAGVWGWWEWVRGTGADGAPLRVHRLSARARVVVAAATLAAWPAAGLVLAHATDSDVPYLDALPTVGSITGQLLLGRKLVENWRVWLAVDLVSTIVFAVKGLWRTVGLYAVFCVLAAWGWRSWARLADAQAGGLPAAPVPARR